MKKITSLLLALIFVLNVSVPIFASTNIIVFEDENYIFETVEDSENYKKYKLTNILTQEIEYLEEYTNELGFTSYIATTDEDTYYIDNYGSSATVSDSNKDVIDVIELYDESSLEEEMEESLISPAAWSSWSGPVTNKYSKSTKVATASLAIGIIATIFGVPASYSICISIGTYIWGESITNVYYKVDIWYRYNEATWKYQRKSTTTIYEVSNYTGYLGENTITTEGSLDAR